MKLAFWRKDEGTGKATYYWLTEGKGKGATITLNEGPKHPRGRTQAEADLVKRLLQEGQVHPGELLSVYFDDERLAKKALAAVGGKGGSAAADPEVERMLGPAVDPDQLGPLWPEGKPASVKQATAGTASAADSSPGAVQGDAEAPSAPADDTPATPAFYFFERGGEGRGLVKTSSATKPQGKTMARADALDRVRKRYASGKSSVTTKEVLSLCWQTAAERDEFLRVVQELEAARRAEKKKPPDGE